MFSCSAWGVDVRIITPGIPDKKMVFKVTRSYYEPLVNGGVKFTNILQGLFMLRTLFVMIKLQLCGTINMDYRSLYLHFECGVYIYDVPIKRY